MKPRQALLLLVDAAALALALLLAYCLRFEFRVPVVYLHDWLRRLAVLWLAFLPLYTLMGLYRGLWRYTGTRELLQIAAAVTAGSFVHAGLVYGLGLYQMPRSIPLILWSLALLFAGGIRLAERLRREWPWRRQSNGGKRTLIVGAGEAGSMLLRELTQPKLKNDYHVVGLIDDDQTKHRHYLRGVPILGGRESIPEAIEEKQVQEIVIAIPSAPQSIIRELVEICRPTGVALKTLPCLHELIDGRVAYSRVREVRIEDLLGRPPANVDLEEIAQYLRGEVVLVTGAGGSIGSELCRQIARFQPKALLLLGRGENSIYEIDLELRMENSGLNTVPIIADVRDRQRLEHIFTTHRPAIVFHAAAHKHVPLMEDAPDEAIKNNVFGTLNVAELAHLHGAKSFVLISTDKAVRPTSVMGATKRAAELIVQDLATRSRTKFCAVRFGNVLGSRGSVIPLFERQIARGGPVTVTDEQMVRYFMTIPEAVNLLIQAGAMCQGGEIYVLDMGEPVRIADLARDMIRLSGFEPDKDIKIEFTGIRPGEKLYEEIMTAEEGIEATRNERILVARLSKTKGREIEQALRDLWSVRDEPAACVEELKALIPRYQDRGLAQKKIRRVKQDDAAV